jgi:hypothetical protein
MIEALSEYLIASHTRALTAEELVNAFARDRVQAWALCRQCLGPVRPTARRKPDGSRESLAASLCFRWSSGSSSA